MFERGTAVVPTRPPGCPSDSRQHQDGVKLIRQMLFQAVLVSMQACLQSSGALGAEGVDLASNFYSEDG